MTDYDIQYAAYQQKVEEALENAVAQTGGEWPVQGIPKHLAEAMRYSLLSGGKRLRAVLLLAAYHAFNDQLDAALPFAAAVECIHTYSLIHDDLPAMDDDDLRRGKPTNHKVYGEALAILAGDALLNRAFELMAGSGHEKALEAIRILAKSAGPEGMIAGQAADILSSGSMPREALVRYIHQHKTADLITAPVVMGLCLAGAGESALQAGQAYGMALGLAFQITDDLLDLEGDPSVTGKQGHRDQALGKLTWPAAVGEDQARLDAGKLVDQAVEAAQALGKRADFFRSLAISIPLRVK